MDISAVRLHANPQPADPGKLPPQDTSERRQLLISVSRSINNSQVVMQLQAEYVLRRRRLCRKLSNNRCHYSSLSFVSRNLSCVR